MDKIYDYIIVGAGLYGAVFAHQMKIRGKKCLVIDKRKHYGGNIYCENVEGINVHKYGPHIFHTNNKRCWDFVCSLVDMNNFVYSPLASNNGVLYNLPFNMNTFYKLWGVQTPNQAKDKIKEQTKNLKIDIPQNLEEQALSMVGPDIYYKLIKGYTEKQWGRLSKELPAFIIKRIPMRFTYDNNYFNDRYQGIPIGGYNNLIEKLLAGVELKLYTNFLTNRQYFEKIAKHIIYTGRIDEFYNYQFGRLEYRSLSFEHQILAVDNYQGNAAINYTGKDLPFTRIVEHKHFEFGQQKHTVITKEYPASFTNENEPFYPINDDYNNKIFLRYNDLAKHQTKYQFGGRLGSYKYYDMDDTIVAVFNHVESEMKNSNRP